MGLLIGKTGIMVANPSAERLLTRGVGSQLTGASIFDRLPDHHALIHTILNRALAGEAVSFPDPTLEGATELSESLGFEFELIPIANARGGFDGAMVTFANVGADQQRIRELTESEARLRLALHASGMVGTWTLDIATGHATADANVARVYGLPETECFSGIDAALFEKRGNTSFTPKINPASWKCGTDPAPPANLTTSSIVSAITRANTAGCA
jgi:hypothetical protein